MTRAWIVAVVAGGGLELDLFWIENGGGQTSRLTTWLSKNAEAVDCASSPFHHLCGSGGTCVDLSSWGPDFFCPRTI